MWPKPYYVASMDRLRDELRRPAVLLDKPERHLVRGRLAGGDVSDLGAQDQVQDAFVDADRRLKIPCAADAERRHASQTLRRGACANPVI